MNKGVYSMNKTMEMYSPSHKKRVMAEVIEGYAQNGKGGSPRLALKGLFEGKKTLPKKVDAETFEKYGFNAEEFSAVSGVFISSAIVDPRVAILRIAQQGVLYFPLPCRHALLDAVARNGMV